MTKQNRLANEKSPYLLQHAGNPVDWYPWGEEAFEKAAREDKPILLSIGYSTCHWCHVMEHESFEDPDVARLMNEAFVSIKVDREERPDIDAIYMTVCQILSKGGCGWPLNIVMTPDRKPFFAATYIPKEARFGRAGMVDLVPKIKEIWDTQREEVIRSAESITAAMRKAADTRAEAGTGAPGMSALTTGFNQLHGRFDEIHGGFGTRPKFPTPHNLVFLLRYWKRTGDEEALFLVEKTLTEMRLGGIYDHVGFGFHRYSTDPEWLLPHFEKMLYDQALLIMAYTEAYEATRKEAYKKTAQEIIAYVLRDMTSPEGGFYSAEDADSEGVEGKFYVWTTEELEAILREEDGGLIARLYNALPGGNFSEEASGESSGENILYLRSPLDEIAGSFGPNAAGILERVERARKKLFEAREKRIHPYKDDKILTDWNGLMIAALSKAAAAFGEPAYSEAAKKAAGFLLMTMRGEGGRLLHRYRTEEAGITAHADDYAFLIWGLLELYEATFETEYLKTAIALQKDMNEHYLDTERGGYYFTANDAEEMIIRHKEVYDGAVPSANSAALLNLLRIGRITGDASYEEAAGNLAKAFSAAVDQAPSAYTQLLLGLDFGIGPSYEIVLAGERGSEDTEKMIDALRKVYAPNKIVLLRDSGPGITDIAPFTKEQETIGGKAAAYVCMNYECDLPVTDPEKVRELLSK